MHAGGGTNDRGEKRNIYGSLSLINFDSKIPGALYRSLLYPKRDLYVETRDSEIAGNLVELAFICIQ